MSSNTEPLVSLARIGAPHGVRGALAVHQAGAHLRQFAGKRIRVCKVMGDADGILTDYIHNGDFTLSRIEPVQGQPVRVAFAEISDRDAAAAFTHSIIAVPLTELRTLAAAERKALTPAIGDLWYFELIGLAVVDSATGTELGKIAAVEDLGLNTVVTVAPAAGQTLLAAALAIPLDYPHWQNVDLTGNRVLLSEWQIF
jgi:ribosomal 30S subunit maturation factor RimM